MPSSPSTTTTTNELSPEAQKLVGMAMPGIEGTLANPPVLPEGSQIAPFTPLQQTAQNTAVNTATNQIDPLVSSTVGTHQNLQSTAIPTGTAGLTQLAGGASTVDPLSQWFGGGGALNVDSNPYLQQYASGAVGDLSDELMQTILPGIRRGAQTSGQVGSSRQGIAEGLAIGDFQQEAGDMLSGIYSNAYGQGLDATGKAMGDLLGSSGDAASSLLSEGTRSLFAAPELAGLAMLPSQILDAVGTQQQTMNQNLMTEEASKFMTEQLMPYLLSSDLLGMAFGAPGGTTTSSSGGGSPLGTILGIGSMMAGLPIF